jgi:hypothetical protein
LDRIAVTAEDIGEENIKNKKAVVTNNYNK